MTSEELAEIDQLVSDIAHEMLQAYRQSFAEANEDERLELIAKYSPALLELQKMLHRAARPPRKRRVARAAHRRQHTRMEYKSA